MELYRREGIDVSHVRVVEGVASGVALIFVDDRGENLIGVAPGANHRLTPEDIDRLPDSLFRRTTCSWSAWRSRRDREPRHCVAAGMRESYHDLEPGTRPALSESKCGSSSRAVMITPNRVEAMAMAGMTHRGGESSPIGRPAAFA